ncbi:hypothetical protein AB0E00_00745 [Streptomyces sp. NPDC048110]|uniref:hypothetical protein n=1 Tax=Streptomyces sp. NPDC048110 TaxID=3155483 RepID=UPI0033DDC686
MNTDLLVPVRLRALVVNDDVRRRDSFHRWTPNYRLLKYRRSPDPSPYDSTDTGFATDPKNDGVYLHWELPAALRRATTPGGEVTLPPAPNRWLVVRHAYTADGEYATAAWVVESDFLDGGKGTAPYLRPGRGQVNPTRIGRHTEAAQWTESAARQPTFLTAIGPGSLSFAAFQPHCQNVFSFHDPLALLPDPYDRLAYQVIGWHAVHSDDPLADPQVREAPESSLGWQTDSPPPPGTRTVYTGRVHSVLRRHDPTDEQWPDPTVAVADSADSALTALAADKVATDPALTLAPALLDQLQSGTLDRADEPDHTHRLADIRLGAGFAEGTTSYAWHAVPPSTAQEPASPHDEQQAREAEAALNAAQHAYDEAERELAGLRRRLHGMWRLQGLRVLPDGYRERLAQELDLRRADSLAARVRTRRQETEHLRARIPGGDTPEQLAASVGQYAQQHLPAGWDLKRVAPAPFHRALDPAVVLQGAGSLPAPDDTTLPCRFGDRTVTAVHHPGSPDGLNAERGDLACNTLALGAGEHSVMPGSTRALLREAFLLDPNCPVVLGAGSRPDAGAVPTPRTGTAPAFGGDPWEQPWNPLHLLWKIEYHPLPHGQWEFDGDDYTCTAPRPEPARTYTGRTLLSDHLPRSLAGRIRQYALHAPELAPHCDALAYRVDQGDILSSSLAGLRDMLIGQDPGQGVPPLGAPPELAELIGDAYRTSPDPGPLPDDLTGWPDSGFQPMRAGQFRFLRLTLVDSFGRALDVITPAGTGGTSGHRHPVVADRLRPQHVPEALDTTPEHVVQLPPRLPQAARLGLELMDATRDTYQAASLGDGNPIAGWIVPNPIDASLAVYDPDGTALGLLRRAYRLGRPAPEAVWTPLPHEPAGLPALSATSPHLRALITWFQGDTAEDSPLPAALGILKSSLVDVVPTAGATSASAALAGRPLALVRCRLQLDLDGPPPTDPGWQHVFDPAPPSPEFTDHRWPVRLGEQQRLGDGLVGYFTDTEPGVLRTVAAPDATHPQLAAIGDGTHLQVMAGTPQHLTLLADPHAPVHATTGLLPTTTLEIPRRFTDGPLDRMRTVLRSGPLLTPAATAGEGTVALPVRTVDDQTWTWAERATDGATWTHFATSAASTTPRWTGRAPVLRSGLLTSFGPPPPPPLPAADTTSP